MSSTTTFASNVVHAVLMRGGDEQALDNLVATFHGGNAVHGVGVVHAIPLIEIILEIQTISATALRFNNWIFFRGFVNLFYGAIYGFVETPSASDNSCPDTKSRRFSK